MTFCRFHSNPDIILVGVKAQEQFPLALHMLFDEGDTCGLFSGAIMVSNFSHQFITLSY
jgi:hypothetical protein